MGKEFSEWMKDRRRTVELPSGIEIEVRRPSPILLASMGPLPGIEEIGDAKRQAEISRRYVEVCLVRIGNEKDPIRRGIIEADDFSFEELDLIVDAVVEMIHGKKEKEGGEGIPLEGTASPQS